MLQGFLFAISKRYCGDIIALDKHTRIINNSTYLPTVILRIAGLEKLSKTAL